jgi:hypothetical protein
MNVDTKIIDGSTAVIRPEGRLTMVSTAGLRSLVAETVAVQFVGRDEPRRIDAPVPNNCNF